MANLGFRNKFTGVEYSGLSHWSVFLINLQHLDLRDNILSYKIKRSIIHSFNQSNFLINLQHLDLKDNLLSYKIRRSINHLFNRSINQSINLSINKIFLSSCSTSISEIITFPTKSNNQLIKFSYQPAAPRSQ